MTVAPNTPATRISLRPAGAEKFDPAVLRPVRPLPVGITREWAWGGSTGAGVSVTLIVVSSLLSQWEDTRWSRGAAAGRSLIGARWRTAL